MKTINKTLIIMLSLLSLIGCKKPKTDVPIGEDAKKCEVQFDADSAFRHIKAQCDFGARTPGSAAHTQCGDYIVKSFQALGLNVIEQKAPITMWDKKQFECRNIIAQYKPEAKERIIICTHWDSRPWADNDPDESKHNEPVMAANDGASGVGVMLEVAAKLKEVNPKVGIDFICFDLEDYGNHDSSDESSWCKGSAYWAAHPHVEGYQALHGILLDMVGGNGVVFRQEIFSTQYAPQVLYQVWDAARVAGYENYFPSEQGGMITDDHIPMNQAGIPTIDIISSNRSGNGFCDTWHTTRDTPENISTATLKAVGQTLLQVLSQEPL